MCEVSLREKPERWHVTRPDQREMFPVDCQHVHDVQSLRRSHHACVDKPEWRVAVDAHELSRALDVFGGESLEHELTVADRTRERYFGVRTDAPAEEICDLGQHDHWNQDIVAGPRPPCAHP